MKKFYVHHNYTNELVWYFFHGSDLKAEDIPAFFFKEQNKKVTLHTYYKSTPIEINFCGDDMWDKLDGNHIFDIHTHLMQEGIVSDRGYNYKTVNYFEFRLKEKLINLGNILGEKLNIFYIDWEGRNHAYTAYKIKNSKIFVDEIVPNHKAKNNYYVFTNNFLSYIHDSNLNIKHSYFLYDFLKEIKPKHKLSYSVRRIIGEKIKQIKSLLEIPAVYITYSSYSFTEDSVDSSIDKEVDDFRNFIQEKIKDNYINKRGYGINDWGIETNINNIHEMYFKILPLAEVEIIDEWMELDYISEKSVIRILSGKPFLPSSFKLFDFYNKIQINYGKTPYELSFRYESFEELCEILKNSVNDTIKWEKLKMELKCWVDTTRDNLINICYSNNSYLDIVLNTSKELI